MVEKTHPLGGPGSGPPPAMHREVYQKHSRNISTVSDVSMTLNEPLQRDPCAEIKCILLLDSETERHNVFEAFYKYLMDSQSDVKNPQLYYHHWEHPHNDCTGGNCQHCIRPLAFGAFNGDGGSASSGLPLPVYTATTHESYFRFSVDGATFRLMLLCKDKQKILKITSYDFLLVGMQVKDVRGGLDDNIWEFEWKKLERHSRKAVAPILLLGYFIDVAKLGEGGVSFEKVIENSQDNVRKAGKAHQVIPRFCDFVTGSSAQLCDIFRDVKRLYKHPGYVLQQCAYNNCLTHFTRIIENPNLAKDDLCYKDEEGGLGLGDNPIMIAAKLRHKDLVSSILRSPKFHIPENNEFLADLVHTRNDAGQTLLAMVALQGPELEEQKLLILRKEIQIHCLSDLTHEADQQKLQRCLRGQLKTSAEAATILDQSRALQGIPKTERELKAERGKVWARLFFASLLLSLLFNAIDTGSDILIMIRYWHELVGQEQNDTQCGDDDMEFTGRTKYNLTNSCNETNPEGMISLQCFPQALSPESKFGYTLFFLVVPWPFFIYEFFTSRHYHHLVVKGGELVTEMSRCKSIGSLMLCYAKAIVYCISFVSCLLFWPIAVLFIKYYNDGKYYLAKGAQKVAREKKVEMSEVLFSTARVMEVSLESSFQPTIQLYIIFPALVREMTASTFDFRIFRICKNQGGLMLKTNQTISIITSILSLAWCFTFYHATLKRGALDRDLAALFYRCVLFLAVLFQILGRLFILVLFSYAFQPGNYYPVLIFLAAHILLMTILHFVFSDAKVYWQKGGFLNLSFFHYMIGNGLANIYIHNWIRMDPLLIPFTKPLQHVSTLVRQLLFDLIFVAENLTLLLIALNANVIEIQEQKVQLAVILMGFTVIGLVLKCVYYRYLHIWAWLIMDYITKKEDGHWHCLLFSNMYFMGELKERELLLCCIPRPIFKAVNYLCGDKYFSSTNSSCSLCAAIFTVLLVPVAFVLALVIVTLVVVLLIAFLPVFLLTIFPCVIAVKCRQTSGNDNVVKIVDDDEEEEDGRSEDDEDEDDDAESSKVVDEGFPLKQQEQKNRQKQQLSSADDSSKQLSKQLTRQLFKQPSIEVINNHLNHHAVVVTTEPKAVAFAAAVNGHGNANADATKDSILPPVTSTTATDATKDSILPPVSSASAVSILPPSTSSSSSSATDNNSEAIKSDPV